MFTVFISVIRTENFFSLWKGVSPVSNYASLLILTLKIIPAALTPLVSCMHAVSTQSMYALSVPFPHEYHITVN